MDKHIDMKKLKQELKKKLNKEKITTKIKEK